MAISLPPPYSPSSTASPSGLPAYQRGRGGDGNNSDGDRDRDRDRAPPVPPRESKDSKKRIHNCWMCHKAFDRYVPTSLACPAPVEGAEYADLGAFCARRPCTLKKVRDSVQSWCARTCSLVLQHLLVHTGEKRTSSALRPLLRAP